jgi:hypothetical protein
VIPVLLILILVACGIPSGEDTPSSGAQTGHWKLLCEAYNPVAYDLCDAISFPAFEGKTREAWEQYSISIGKVDHTFITWAEGGQLSGDGRHLVYSSNKDCLEEDNTMSVFLFDLYSGQERVLLSGTDARYYSALTWLDDNTLLCLSAPSEVSVESPTYQHLICDLEGNVIPIAPKEFPGPVPFAVQGRMLAWTDGPEGNMLRLVRIEADGRVSELARQSFDGYPINGGGVSPDGKWVAFPLRPQWGDDPSRSVCLWDTEAGTVVLLDNPTPREGTDPAAIWVWWNGAYPEVDFNISDAPNPNGHNELWQYVFRPQVV